MAWRFIAQRISTGQFLDWDVPLKLDGSPRRELTGPGSMSGSIDPVYARLKGLAADGLPVLDEWSTALYAEYEGRIRWGGLVVSVKWAGQAQQVQCIGFTGYANGMPYIGDALRAGYKDATQNPYAGLDRNHDGYVDFSNPKRKVPPLPAADISPPVDAFDLLRLLWGHLQDQPGGNLGLDIDGHDSGYLLGSPTGDSPYEMTWWDAKDIGSELTTVMAVAEADWEEEHLWDSGNQKVLHRLHLGGRRLGRQRDDLRFAQGENIIAMATPTGMGEAYASQIHCIGAGSGSATAWARVENPPGLRLRRCRVISRKDQTNAAILRTLADKELSRSTQMITVPSIAVADHPNARLGSWHLGDWIYLQIHTQWTGEIRVWHRIVADEINPVDGTAILTLTRADRL